MDANAKICVGIVERLMGRPLTGSAFALAQTEESATAMATMILEEVADAAVAFAAREPGDGVPVRFAQWWLGGGSETVRWDDDGDG